MYNELKWLQSHKQYIPTAPLRYDIYLHHNTVNRKIFNSNILSRLAKSTKIEHMKIRGGEKLLDALHYCTFYLAQLIGIIIYLLTVYGLLDISRKNLPDGSLHNPTEPLPVA